MAEKSWATGEVLSSSDLNVWALPLTGIKSANQTIISTTTLINDADMRVAVASSAVYDFACFVRFSSATGADIKLSMSAPSGSDCIYMGLRRDNTGAFGGSGDFHATDSFICQGQGVGVINTALMIGTLFTTTTSGNLIGQWAQNVSTASNTVLYQYSRITARRIG